MLVNSSNSSVVVGLLAIAFLSFQPVNVCAFQQQHQQGVSSSSFIRTGSPSLLFLTPQQGLELKQASEQVYGHQYEETEEDEGAHELYSHNKQLPLYPVVVEKQRSFVRRAFSLPSSFLHPHPKVEGVADAFEMSGHAKDVVYFPVVGFTFVKDRPGHSRPLPGMTNASCRLRCGGNEVFYGSFHPIHKAIEAPTTTSNLANELP